MEEKEEKRMNVFHLLSIFFVPGTVLDSKFRLYMFLYLILMK